MRYQRNIVFGLLLILLLSGCAGRDRALVLPVAEQSADGGGTDTFKDEEAADGAGQMADTTKATVSDTESVEPEETAMICVYVCGAVKTAGVVLLPAGSRAADALEAAGGFAEDAREDALNLAEVLTDGQMLRFPTFEESAETWEDSAAVDGKVNINTADVAQLTALNGIGSARAQDIVTYRESNGAFETIEEIQKVPGIKAATFEKIKEHIVVR